MSSINSSKKQGTDERLLVAGCVSGDQSDWNRFIERYGPIVRTTARAVVYRYGYVGREIDDMVSVLYEKLIDNDYRRLRAWRGQAKFSTYLVQVAKNIFIDYIRARGKDEKRRVELDTVPATDMACFDDPAESEKDPRINDIENVIDQLSTKQAMILRLRLDGKTLREIAAFLNIPEGTVFVENSRAIRKLRKILIEK